MFSRYSVSSRRVYNRYWLIWIYQDIDEPTATSDTENMAEDSPELFDMKRRFTLVTAEEPIPLNAEDLQEHPSIIDTIPPVDGT